MGLLQLTKDERKICYRIIDMKLFKKMLKSDYGMKFMRMTGKRIEKFEYVDLVNYVEGHLLEEENSIINSMVNLITTTLMKDMEMSESLFEAIQEQMDQWKENKEDQQEDYEEVYSSFKQAAEPYRNGYDLINHTNCTYDMLIALFMPDLEHDKEVFQSDLDMKKQEKEIEKKLKEYDTLAKEKADLEYEVSQAKKDLKALQESNNELIVSLQKYQDVFNLDIYKRKLTGILKVSSLVNLTEDEIYERLSEEEKKAYEKDDYERLGNVLAAKYFLIKIKGVE